MLYEIYKEKLESITKTGMFKLYPKWADRAAWDSIDADLKCHIISEAEEYLGHEWPRFSASDYMEYYREGSRKSWDKVFKSVFDALTKLTIAECTEGKGRFLNDIVNGVWARCEDTSWVHTGHLNHHGDEQVPLYDVNYLDLRACSTGSQLAHVYYLLKPQLDKISPHICSRIEYEINRRIINNYLNNDHWWTNLTDGGTINNWNTHCNKNVIRTALIMEKDPEKLKAVMEKACRSLDVFLSIHADDGACDEGPGYWKGAGFSYLTILSFLCEIYDINVDIFLDERIKNMGSYIYKVIICDDYYMSYADGNGRNPMYDVKLYKTGLMLEDSALVQLAVDTFRIHRDRDEYYDYFIYIIFDYLEYIMGYRDVQAELITASKKAYYLRNCALHDAHIASARQFVSNVNGFFTGIKGGHNDESHNHNDIGVFYLYYNGKPVVIDAAAGMYTNKTFSPKRYDIWTMQSQWHSLPVINGYMQKDGIEYKSESFKVLNMYEISMAEMEILNAYPSEARLKSFTRKIILDRENQSVTLFDEINMIKSTDDIMLFLTVLYEPEISDTGDILLSNGVTTIFLDYDKNLLKPYLEVKDISMDKKLRESWGDKIYRLGFKVIEPKLKNEIEFIFKVKNGVANE